MRAFAAVVTAVAVCAAAPAFADAQSHVQAAKKAERKGEWHKALEEWKAAYRSDVNAEYLIGIGDAYAHIGNKAEAKKNYQAYLADPLALPTNVEKVKQKIAELDNPGGALALPGGPGLALPGADAPPPLPLDSAPSAKKGKTAPPPLELPGATPAAQAKNEPPPLELPGMAPAPAKKEPEKKLASASPGLELPLPGSPPLAARTEPPTAKKEPPKTVAVATPPPPPPAKRAPDSAVADTRHRACSRRSARTRR